MGGNEGQDLFPQEHDEQGVQTGRWTGPRKPPPNCFVKAPGWQQQRGAVLLAELALTWHPRTPGGVS